MLRINFLIEYKILGFLSLLSGNALLSDDNRIL